RVDALREATVPAVWDDGPSVDAGVLTAIAQACRDQERLRFSYTAQAGEQSLRHVEPHRLVSLGRRWYLVAFDLTREDWRSFRLDRVEKARCTEMRFAARELPARDAATFVRAGIGSLQPAQHSVEAVIHAPIASVRTLVGRRGTLDQLDERTCRLRMTVDNLHWPMLALGGMGAEFEVLRPPELIDRVREWGARFTRSTQA
ncbi:MAG: WYL domain-containing protein, partial [Chloroflexota bacterium]|nr:WYL domain-containing protein [Chloroflexota bacterium]